VDCLAVNCLTWDVTAVVGMNQSKCVKTATLGIARTVGRVLGQVVLHQGKRILDVAAMNNTQAGGGRELGPVKKCKLSGYFTFYDFYSYSSTKIECTLKCLPVGSSAEPLKVVEQEGVMGRSAMHVAVGNYRACVADGDADSVFRLLQDQQIGLIVADQELEKNRKRWILKTITRIMN